MKKLLRTFVLMFILCSIFIVVCMYWLYNIAVLN